MRTQLVILIALAACKPPTDPATDSDDTEILDTEVEVEVEDTDNPLLPTGIFLDTWDTGDSDNDTGSPPDTDSDGDTAPVPPPIRTIVLAAAGYRTWSDGTAAASCEAYRRPAAPDLYDGDIGDGRYLIDLDGVLGLNPAFEVYCDMTTSDGGWTLAVQSRPNDTRGVCTDAGRGQFDLDDTTVSDIAKMSDAQINDLWDAGSTHEVLVKADTDSADVSRTAWDRVCTVDFADTYTFSTQPNAAGMSDLDSISVRCSTGASFVVAFQTSNTAFCGWSLSSAQQEFVIYGIEGDFGPAGSCSSHTFGRGALGPLAAGCTTQKIFVR